MSSLRIMDILKLTFKAVQFKYDEMRLTTSINATVDTKLGSVKGVKRKSIWGDEYFSFEKIPYAKPPLEELRFRAPEPVEPWDTVLDCTGPAEKPMQSNMLFRKYQGSEDCLYLNVFATNITPETPNRPVMVWIYGGGFQLGEATRNMYSPDFFMSTEVVLVTIAYRLGPFGFLSLDDPALNVPGNAGIKDQILALKWVKENIRAFGGNPDNITVFGESAGGASTHLCMLSERSKGLINKGIIMSGSALCPWARPPKNHWAYRLAKSLGYAGENADSDVYKFLRAAKAPDMVKVAASVLSSEEKHNRVLFAFGPVVEPYLTEQCVLSEEPHVVMQKTWSNEIPLMIGGTSFEGLLFYPEVTRRPATLDEVGNCTNMLPFDLGLEPESKEAKEHAFKLKQTYFGDEECSSENKMQFLELESYREFWHPIYRTVLARLQHSSAPTYLYRFDYDSKDGNAIRNIVCGTGVRGVCHGDDMCYLYHTIFSHRAGVDSTEAHVARTMIDVWTCFAAKTDPNGTMLRRQDVDFVPLTKDGEMKCLNISEKVEMIELPELQKLKVWSSFYPHGKL